MSALGTPSPAVESAATTERWSALVGGVRVLFGEGRLAELGEAARALGGERALLVTDPGVRQAGHAAAAEAALRAAGLAVTVFAAVNENPTSDDVAAGAAFAAAIDRGVDLIAAVGGGSALDTAKGINFLLTNGGRMEDYQGHGRATRPMLPSIGVPTTAGTGSEAQSYALISDPVSHRKMACGDDKARFRTVILDPALTATAPARVVATAGLDAVSHAVESYVSTRANPPSRLLAGEAWRLLAANLEIVLAAWTGSAPAGPPLDGAAADPDATLRRARAAVAWAAHLAGAAIEQSMLGAAHACANPLTARHGIVHGEAVALMLPAVVRFNAPAAGERYGELAKAAGLGSSSISSGEAADALASHIESLRAAGGLATRLRDRGVDADALPELAAEAAEQWTGRFNPRPVAQAELLRALPRCVLTPVAPHSPHPSPNPQGGASHPRSLAVIPSQTLMK